MDTVDTINTLDATATDVIDTLDARDAVDNLDASDASIAMAEYTYEYNEFTYEYDIFEKKLVNDCNFYPSSTSDKDFRYLLAVNNKCSDDSIEPEKVGKWVIHSPDYSIDAAWDKIKKAVTSGDLWRSEVSTSNRKKFGQNHTIFIYTPDSTDVDDLVNVLDYLEASGIKPRNVVSDYRSESYRLLFTSDVIRSIYAQRIRRAMQTDAGKTPWS